MGQQQLLLIVLGVILVGVAVVLGIQYFAVGAEEGAKDELVAHNLVIGSNAQQWYKKPVAMGGGGGAFDNTYNTVEGFDDYFAGQTNLHSTPNSLSYTLVVEQDLVTITALPKANQGFTFVSVVTTVTPAGMSTVVN